MWCAWPTAREFSSGPHFAARFGASWPRSSKVFPLTPAATASCIPLRERSSKLVRRFTHVDYAKHVALVAETFVDSRESVIGEARYVRVAEPSSAEVSMSVADRLAGQRPRQDACQARKPCGRRGYSPADSRDLGGELKVAIACTRRRIFGELRRPGVIRLEKTLMSDPAGPQVQ